MKYCGGCKQEKNESDFSHSKYTSDGLQTQCRDCFKDYRAFTKYKKTKSYDEGRDTFEQFKQRTKIVVAVRTLIYQFKKGMLNESKLFVERVGCTWEEYKLYIESQWRSGMTWENHAVKGWHIDHRIPLSSFDFFNEEQVKRALHYTNTQPLWAIENLEKGASIDG